MEEEKAVKYVKQYAIAFIVIEGIICIWNMTTGFNPISIISVIISIGLLIGAYMGANQKKMYGAICGIIFSVLTIITFNIINIILGIFFLINSINMYKALK